ncbi:Mce family protein [Nocardia farcinica]|uniref:MCE family protein n=1 Tax=Nocardia farcinica TaxID=37329 RepID=UPI000A36A6D0|nr:MCE family protein [Nocardia farcinica]SUE28854.1 Mce family protein [Nocardia farcinica]
MGHLRQFGDRVNVALGLAFVLTVVAVTMLSVGIYRGSFSDVVRVTLYADRSGLLLERGSEVKMYGVVVGHVEDLAFTDGRARITMTLAAEHSSAIPPDVRAAIDPTTLFGRKFVVLTAPEGTSARGIADGAVIPEATVTSEVDDLLEALVTVLRTIEVDKLKSTVDAVTASLRTRGPEVGRLVDDLRAFLGEFNPHLDTLQRDMRAAGDAADALAAAAPDLLTTVDRLSTTSDTITEQQTELSAFLLSFTAFGNSGADLFATSGEPLRAAAAALNSPTAVLSEFAPIYPCFLADLATTNALLENTNSGSGRPGLNILGTLLMGDPPYRPSVNLPRTGLDNAPSCYETGDEPPGHVRFDDGSNAYHPVTDPTDYIGNPLAELLFGGWR